MDKTIQCVFGVSALIIWLFCPEIKTIGRYKMTRHFFEICQVT